MPPAPPRACCCVTRPPGPRHWRLLPRPAWRRPGTSWRAPDGLSRQRRGGQLEVPLAPAHVHAELRNDLIDAGAGIGDGEVRIAGLDRGIAGSGVALGKGQDRQVVGRIVRGRSHHVDHDIVIAERVQGAGGGGGVGGRGRRDYDCALGLHDGLLVARGYSPRADEWITPSCRSGQRWGRLRWWFRRRGRRCRTARNG